MILNVYTTKNFKIHEAKSESKEQINHRDFNAQQSTTERTTR